MNKLQYFHHYDKYQEGYAIQQYTACVMVPSREEITALLTASVYSVPPSCFLAAGLTFCHPKDQYTKSIGRTEALTRTKTIEFDLDSIKVRSFVTEIVLRCLDFSSDIESITLEMGENRKKPHLINVTPRNTK